MIRLYVFFGSATLYSPVYRTTVECTINNVTWGAQKQAFLIILEQEIDFQNNHNRPIQGWREG
jgi:hypothetical protein